LFNLPPPKKETKKCEITEANISVCLIPGGVSGKKTCFQTWLQKSILVSRPDLVRDKA